MHYDTLALVSTERKKRLWRVIELADRYAAIFTERALQLE